MDEISRFGATQLQEFPEDLRKRVGEIAERSGFVPNVFRGLAHRPAELRAFLDYHDALMDSDDGLSKAELGEHHLQAAADAGLSEHEIWDIGAITALFAMSNRLAHLMALRPNAEFFPMGRNAGS